MYFLNKYDKTTTIQIGEISKELCGCGSKVLKKGMSQHTRTIKHREWKAEQIKADKHLHIVQSDDEPTEEKKQPAPVQPPPACLNTGDRSAYFQLQLDTARERSEEDGCCYECGRIYDGDTCDREHDMQSISDYFSQRIYNSPIGTMIQCRGPRPSDKETSFMWCLKQPPQSDFYRLALYVLGKYEARYDE